MSEPTTPTLSMLEAVARGELSPAAALEQWPMATGPDTRAGPVSLNLGHSTLDMDRARRTGAAEVVFGEGKSATQLIEITQALSAAQQPVLITRASAEKFQALQTVIPSAVYHPQARLIWLLPDAQTREPSQSTIAVVSAGTSDAAVSEEAALTCEFYGQRVARINDVGVAGIHRLFARLEEIRAAKVVIVVAGMEGALPSAVGGLVERPVIAVPTSIGYGASFGGLSALLGMLNSCASGVSVVNIDNGFGAGYLATMINRL